MIFVGLCDVESSIQGSTLGMARPGASKNLVGPEKKLENKHEQIENTPK